VNFFNPWNNAFSESLKRHDGKFIERRETCLKNKLFNQMRIFSFDNPNELFDPFNDFRIVGSYSNTELAKNMKK